MLFILFSVYPTIVDVLAQWSSNPLHGLSTIGVYGSQYGYSIVQFVLMYIIGGFLARIDGNISQRKLIGILVSNTILITAWSYLDKISGYTIEANAWEYCNPLVVLGAVCLFLIFKQVQYSSRIINNMSKACFTMYLLHPFSYSLLNVKAIVNHVPLIMLCEILIISLVVFIICYMIYIVYQQCEKGILTKINYILLNLSHCSMINKI